MMLLERGKDGIRNVSRQSWRPALRIGARGLGSRVVGLGVARGPAYLPFFRLLCRLRWPFRLPAAVCRLPILIFPRHLPPRPAVVAGWVGQSSWWWRDRGVRCGATPLRRPSEQGGVLVRALRASAFAMCASARPSTVSVCLRPSGREMTNSSPISTSRCAFAGAPFTLTLPSRQAFWASERVLKRQATSSQISRRGDTGKVSDRSRGPVLRCLGAGVRYCR